MTEISGKQQQAFDEIKKFISTHGSPPTVHELCGLLGLKSSSTAHGVRKHVGSRY
jgi:SOS-response transcriptional repressor LexA